MRHILHVFLILAILVPALLPAAASAAESDAEQGPPLSMRWELYRAGETEPPSSLLAVFWITPGPGHYIYGHELGVTGLPTNVDIRTSPALDAVAYYPAGKMKPDAFDPAVQVEAYEGPTPIFFALDTEGGPLPNTLELAGDASMLLCSDVSCRPINQTVTETFNLSGAEPGRAEDQEWFPLFAQTSVDGPDEVYTVDETVAADTSAEAPTEPEVAAVIAPAPPAGQEQAATVESLDLFPEFFQPGLEVTSLTKAVLLALVAGFILNFMPCVLPVVSLKLSGLVAAASVEDAETQRAVFREHNFLFALGVLLFFLLLSVVLSLAGMAWGGLFQQPWVLLGATVLLFALGLSLFGVFDLPVIDLKVADTAKSKKSQALFTGMLATLLATPCSGPFLGGVLGWALQQPAVVIAVVFMAIGLGMASPYLAMAVSPGLVRFFPRPGPWTLYLERAAGFFLMGTCAYLITILPDAKTPQTLFLLLVTGFAAWMWGGWTNLSQTATKRWTIRTAAVALMVVMAVLLFRPQPEGVRWEPFSEELFLETLGEDPVMIDFTADWCPNCKVLEATALDHDNLAEWQERYGLRFIQADLTESNPPAQALLGKLRSSSIPVVAVFPAGDRAEAPVVLRDLFSKSQMDDLLEATLE